MTIKRAKRHKCNVGNDTGRYHACTCSGKMFTYANPVVDFCPQKEDPYQTRITASGNLITFKGNASVQTANLDMAKMHWNSVISTRKARYMCLDIKHFYLTAELQYFEYMKTPLSWFPLWIIEQYNLKELAVDGRVYIEMRRTVWGLPQSGILANNCLHRKLAPFGYHECVNTPGLWWHETRAISFTLLVDNFGVKYAKKDDVDNLIASIKSTYSLTEDWTGNMFCGITLDVDISMPGYIKKKLQEYSHIMPENLQACPYSPEPQ